MPRRNDTGLNSDLDNEPRVCLNSNCNFPFQSNCHACHLDVGLRTLSEGYLNVEKRTEAWVGEVLTITEDHLRQMEHDPNAPIFVGCADEDGIAVNDMSGVIEKSEKADHTDTKQQTGLPPQLSESPYVRSGKFDEWISNLLEHTMSDKNFVGGANEISTKESSLRCLMCAELLGDPSMQHLQRCIYAHEERERLKSTI